MSALPLSAHKKRWRKSKAARTRKGDPMELNKQLREDDVVMCTVKRIEGTTVFVAIEGNGEGTLVLSEVAAGRIRNLREYVFPNKKIICKVLKIDADAHIHLSLRRVTGREREHVQEQFKKERMLLSLLAAILRDTVAVYATFEKIKAKYSVTDFLDSAHSNPSLLEEFMKKEDAQKLAVMLSEKEEREKTAKKHVLLKTTAEEGIRDMQTILTCPAVDIRYLGSSQFSITAKGADFKETANKLNTALAEIEKRAKEKKAHFEVKEK